MNTIPRAGTWFPLPRLLKYRSPTPKLIADAYLAAFSIAAQMRFATLDNGFAQFRELDLQLITPLAELS